MKKYQNFLSENFQFLVVKFSIYLNRLVFVMLGIFTYTFEYQLNEYISVSILHKSIAVRYRPVRVADGPITARYRFMYNASKEILKSISENT